LENPLVEEERYNMEMDWGEDDGGEGDGALLEADDGAVGSAEDMAEESHTTLAKDFATLPPGVPEIHPNSI
jgi:hypothetical protein